MVELEEKALQPSHQRRFELPLGGPAGEIEEVEHVRIADQLVGEVRLAGRQLLRELDGAAPLRWRRRPAIW